MDRHSRRGELLIGHAAADVQQHGQADWHALTAERHDVLRLAVVRDDEIVLGEAADESSVAVGHGGSDINDVDARFEDRLLSSGMYKRQKGCRKRKGDG